MNKHQEHIVCVKSSLFPNRENGFADFTLTIENLMLGQRAALEKDPDFRQVLPVSVFMHQGKIWVYERTPKGGEAKLHGKVANLVGGHWDMADLVLDNGVINLKQSLTNASEREIAEEVKLTSKVINTTILDKVICADDLSVDRVHIAIVSVHELDGEGLDSAEDQLKTIGFKTPQELLDGDYNLETWARLICEILVNQK
tara:strand:- start:1780 stop:2379 length:600 start_codon:yes stop_codon:yes gene_type:complete